MTAREGTIANLRAIAEQAAPAAASSRRVRLRGGFMKAAWRCIRVMVAVMLLGYILFVPVGLALGWAE